MSVNAIKRELVFPLFNVYEYSITNHYKFGRFGHYHFCTSKKDAKYYLIKEIRYNRKKIIPENFNRIKIIRKTTQHAIFSSFTRNINQ